MIGERPRPRVFKERTNTLDRPGSIAVVSKPPMDALATPTLQKSPTDVIMVKEATWEGASTNLPRDMGDHQSRRSSRYLAAEQDLSKTLQHCQQEHSTQELQIEALKKVKSMLTNHVTGSREQLDKLQQLLSDRAMEPTLYQAAQRERWMEERRLVAAEELSKVLGQHLSSLSSQLPPPPTSFPPPASREANSPNFTLSSNPEANLVRFFKSTSRQRNFSRNRARRRVAVALRPRSDKGLEPPRVHDHRHPLPLLLQEPKPKQRVPLFQTLAKLTASVPVIPSPIPPTSLTPPPVPTPDPASPPTNHSQPPTLPQISESVPSPQFPTPSLDNTSSGTATIWRASPRSAEEILADSDLVVDMPDYVSDLLAGFDSISNTTAPLRRPRDGLTPHRPLNSKAPRPSVHHHPTHHKTSHTPTIPQSHSTPSAPSRAPPSPLHKSPSRKRISALFSLPEALSSRRGISTDGSSRPKQLSTAILEEPEMEPRRPVSVSVSFADLPSIESGSGESRHREAHGDEKADEKADEKVLKRIRKRMSALLRN